MRYIRILLPSFASQNPPFSLRLGHASALTVHRTVIHYLVAALLPTGEGLTERVNPAISLGNLLRKRIRVKLNLKSLLAIEKAFCFVRLFCELAIIELGVEAVLLEKLGVRALLDDVAVTHNEYEVGFAYR